MSGWIKFGFVLVLLAGVMLLVQQGPEITGKSVSFATDDVVFLDDNSYFESPMLIYPGQEVNLSAGKYYWKTKDKKTRTFEVDSVVQVSYIDNWLKNTGNTEIQVHTNNGRKTLGINDEVNVSGPVEVAEYE